MHRALAGDLLQAGALLVRQFISLDDDGTLDAVRESVVLPHTFQAILRMNPALAQAHRDAL